MTAKKMNVSLQAVIVLFSIAVLCVGLLAVLNYVLYVAPDMSSFSSVAEGEYEAVELDKTRIKNGKVLVATEGTLTDGTPVVGLYISSTATSPASSFTIVIVINRQTDAIIGSMELVDGSTGGYSYDQSRLAVFNGAVITSPDVFNTATEMLQTGATASSKTVRNAFITAAVYYCNVYAQGGQG